MSRAFVGHERTPARKAPQELAKAHPDARDLARLLSLKTHSIVPLLDGRARLVKGAVDSSHGIVPTATLPH